MNPWPRQIFFLLLLSIIIPNFPPSQHDIHPRIPTPSTPLTRVQVSQAVQKTNSTLLQVCKLTSLQFQQPINCCGLTSVAYALSAIGYPTTVDHLFHVIGVDVGSAVGDGMTLAELHDASLRYINRSNIPVAVECYHFDKFLVTQSAFRSACLEDAHAGIDDIVVLNFQTGIAHGWERSGNGHFSVITALSPNARDVIMADVHPIKYGTFWSTPLSQMFSAMTDKDSCGRARGALRFARTDRPLKRPLPGLYPTLLDWTNPPKPFRTAYLQKYIPRKWGEGTGVRNMAGTCALAASMRLLHGDDAPIARLDNIMKALNESYTRHLNNFLTPHEIAVMANRLHESGLSKAVAEVRTLPSCDGETLLTTLKDIGCGEDGVAVLASYDFNDAYGAPLLESETGETGALSHGTKTWSLIADVDVMRDADDTDGVVIAPAHDVILAGRLWTTSANRLAIAMRSLDWFQCNILVLDSR